MGAGRIVLGGLGGLLVTGAFVAMFYRLRFLIGGRVAMATVERIAEGHSERSEYDMSLVTTYDSHLQFTTDAGATVRFVQQHGTSAPRFRVGERVAVRYSPAAAAASAEVPSPVQEMMMWGAMAFVAVLGTAFLFGAVHG